MGSKELLAVELNFEMEKGQPQFPHGRISKLKGLTGTRVLKLESSDKRAQTSLMRRVNQKPGMKNGNRIGSKACSADFYS